MRSLAGPKRYPVSGPSFNGIGILRYLFEGLPFPEMPDPDDGDGVGFHVYHPRLLDLKENLMTWKEQTLGQYL